jgi:hypothetical protein
LIWVRREAGKFLEMGLDNGINKLPASTNHTLSLLSPQSVTRLFILGERRNTLRYCALRPCASGRNDRPYSLSIQAAASDLDRKSVLKQLLPSRST